MSFKLLCRCVRTSHGSVEDAVSQLVHFKFTPSEPYLAPRGRQRTEGQQLLREVDWSSAGVGAGRDSRKEKES